MHAKCTRKDMLFVADDDDDDDDDVVVVEELWGIVRTRTLS
jgi:hypothetical protein